MAPHYDRLLLADCTSAIPTLPEASVDAIITDPPYGVGRRRPSPADVDAYLRGSALDTGGDIVGNTWGIPTVATWRALRRVLKPGRYLAAFAAARMLDVVLAGIREAGLDIVGVHGWVHLQGAGFHATLLKPAWEPIIIASRARPARPPHLETAIYAPKVYDSKLRHPAVKPLRLLRRLIRELVPERGVVLDPYVGSGTTAVAAMDAGRRFIAIERDPRYHAIAATRILEARRKCTPHRR